MSDEHQKFIIFIKDLVAGGIAGAVSRTVVSPLERVKILFQVILFLSFCIFGLYLAVLKIQSPQVTKYHGIFSTFKTIWKQDGWRGYFKGNGTNILRIVPYSAIQFASYEKYKKVSPFFISLFLLTYSLFFDSGCIF